MKSWLVLNIAWLQVFVRIVIFDNHSIIVSVFHKLLATFDNDHNSLHITIEMEKIYLS